MCTEEGNPRIKFYCLLTHSFKRKAGPYFFFDRQAFSNTYFHCEVFSTPFSINFLYKYLGFPASNTHTIWSWDQFQICLIPRNLIKMKKRHREFKILILGSELSGKTTFFKQMQISHGTNPSLSDRKSYSLSIIRAIFLGIQQLIKVVQGYQIGKKFFFNLWCFLHIGI